LWATEWHELFSPAKGFSNDERYHLTWRNRFAGIQNVYNFYSAGDRSGEEVLENSDGTLPALPLPALPFESLPVVGNPTPARWAWVSQEMRKGTWIIDLLTVKCQGGWAPNFNYFIEEHAGNVPVKRIRTPQEANSITDAQLRAQPFFKRFREDQLFDLQQGGAIAANPEIRSEVLGAGVPALSNPAGSNPVPLFNQESGVRNFDLSSENPQSTFKTGWPVERESKRWRRRWLHSDLKDIAFPFNHRLHDRLVGFGQLDQ
jgi:hypothetical protein